MDREIIKVSYNEEKENYTAEFIEASILDCLNTISLLANDIRATRDKEEKDDFAEKLITLAAQGRRFHLKEEEIEIL